MPSITEAAIYHPYEYTKKRMEDGTIILEKTIRSEVDKNDVLEQLQETIRCYRSERAELDAGIAELQAKVDLIEKII